MKKINLKKAISRSLAVINEQNPNISWVDKAMVLRIADEIHENFPEDIENLRKDASFLVDKADRVESQTQQTANIFRNWHIKSSRSSLLAITVFALEVLEIVPDESLQTAILTAAILGEVYNEPAYHSNMHFREVTFQALRLIITHNDIYSGTSKILEEEEIALLIIAACIHDLGHTGKGNAVNGVHVTAKMELHSYILAESYLQACELNRTQLQKIRTMLIATDVSPIGSDQSPMIQMKRAYKHHFHEKKNIYKPVLGEGLLMLEDDATLSLLSLLLHEADISISAGLNYDVTCYETTLLWEEMGRDDPRPSDIINFLEKVCRRRFLSDAGKRCFAPNIARIYALAEEAVEKGNHTFTGTEHSNFILGISDDTSGKTVN